MKQLLLLLCAIALQSCIGLLDTYQQAQENERIRLAEQRVQQNLAPPMQKKKIYDTIKAPYPLIIKDSLWQPDNHKRP